MRTVILCFVICGFMFAQSSEIAESSKQHKVSAHKNNVLSEKEKAYQEYLAKLEEENKQLEDDGFCSCNNN